MRHPILKNAGILAFSGICAKSFDFGFRAMYSAKLGAEGMGLLSLGFGIHGVMLTVSTAGLGVAVSKAASEYLEQGEKGAVRKSVEIAVCGVACLALAVMAVTLVRAEWIAERMLGDVRIASGLCCLVPSVLFMGVSYCLKGYFYAARKVWIPASSEFLEQAVKFVAIRTLLQRWLPNGIGAGCAAVFGGISIGECASCLYLTLFYQRERRSLCGGDTRERIAVSLVRVAFPSMLTSLAGSALRMQEEVVIVSALKRFGFSHAEATGGLGLMYGMAMPMLTFPLTLLGSVTTLLVPEVARRGAERDSGRLWRLVGKTYGMGIAVGTAVWAVLMLFAPELSQGIYHNTEIVPMVRNLAFLLPVMFLDSLSCAVLNGMGKQCSLLVYHVSDSLLRLAAIAAAVPVFGMSAMVWVIIVSNLYTCFLTVRQVVRNCGGGHNFMIFLKKWA